MSISSSDPLKFIFGRRSIRAFQPGDVDEDTVTRLLRAGMAAPSARASDPWRFIVVREKTTLEALAHVLPYGRMLASATVGIVVCGDLDAAHDGQLSYLLQDCAAAIENILLGAHVLGLGSCWIGLHPRDDRMRDVRRVMEIPEALIPVSVIAIGHPGEPKRARTRYNEAYVHREKW